MIRPHRKGTRQAIHNRLAAHSELTKKFEAEGLTREEASQKALKQVSKINRKTGRA